MSDPSLPLKGAVKIEASLLKRARAGDSTAVVTIFRQFIPEEENIYWVEYLGRHGWVFGRHSLGCLTNRRAASIMLGSFGEVVYRDGYLEYANSCVIYQPSKLALYILVFLAVVADLWLSGAVTLGLSNLWDSRLIGILIGALFFFLVGLVLVNLVVRLDHSVRKCGLVIWIKDGVSVYAFTDRKRTQLATAMLRMVTELRDARVAQIGHLG